MSSKSQVLFITRTESYEEFFRGGVPIWGCHGFTILMQ